MMNRTAVPQSTTSIRNRRLNWRDVFPLLATGLFLLFPRPAAAQESVPFAAGYQGGFQIMFGAGTGGTDDLRFAGDGLAKHLGLSDVDGHSTTRPSATDPLWFGHRHRPRDLDRRQRRRALAGQTPARNASTFGPGPHFHPRVGDDERGRRHREVQRRDPAVALGIYARVLQTLRLEDGLGSLAADDALGRKLQDAKLEPKSRAPKRSARVTDLP